MRGRAVMTSAKYSSASTLYLIGCFGTWTGATVDMLCHILYLLAGFQLLERLRIALQGYDLLAKYK